MKANNNMLITSGMMNYDRLQVLINKSKSTQKDIAEYLNVTPNGFRKSLNQQTLTVKSLEGLAVFFNVPVSFFFNEGMDSNTPEQKKYIEERVLDLEIKVNELMRKKEQQKK